MATPNLKKPAEKEGQVSLGAGYDERVWYRVTGRQKGTAILLLPDFDLTHMIYKRTVAYLAQQDRRVLVLDWCGTGESTPAPGKGRKLDVAFYVLQAKAVIDEVFVNQEFSIIAHGVSALFAVRLATIFGAQVKAIVLMSPFGLSSIPKSGKLMCLSCCFCCCLAPCVYHCCLSSRYSHSEMTRRIEDQFYDYDIVHRNDSDVLEHHVKQIDPARPQQRVVQKAYLSLGLSKPSWFKKELVAIADKHPFFLAWGANDTVISSAELLKFKKFLPAATTELFKNGGHCFFLERNPAYHRSLNNFLENAAPALGEGLIKSTTKTLNTIWDSISESITGGSSDEHGAKKKGIVQTLWDSISETFSDAGSEANSDAGSHAS